MNITKRSFLFCIYFFTNASFKANGRVLRTISRTVSLFNCKDPLRAGLWYTLKLLISFIGKNANRTSALALSRHTMIRDELLNLNMPLDALTPTSTAGTNN